MYLLIVCSSTNLKYGPLLPEPRQVSTNRATVGECRLPLLEPRLQVTGREPEGLDARHQGTQYWRRGGEGREGGGGGGGGEEEGRLRGREEEGKGKGEGEVEGEGGGEL